MEKRDKGDKLVPLEMGGELTTTKKEARKRFEDTEAAADLSGIIKKELEEAGKEVNENINYGLWAVEQFRNTIKSAQAIRKAILGYTRLPERDEKDLTMVAKLAQSYAARKRKIDDYVQHYGLSLRKEYGEYIDSQKNFRAFNFLRKKGDEINESLEKSNLADIPQGVFKPDEKSTTSEEQTKYYIEQSLNEENQNLEDEEGAVAVSKEKLKEELTAIKAKIEELWQDPDTRYWFSQQEIKNILNDVFENKDVLETQSTIKILNELDDFENYHRRTTLGAVLVGAPGVGKTTIVRHYLESKGRPYTYIDLSQDVTRYMLFGSKAIEFEHRTEYIQKLKEAIEKMDDPQLDNFVRENITTIEGVMGLSNGDGASILLSQLGELTEDKKSPQNINAIREKITSSVKKAFNKELGGEFAHLVYKNGWRDGVIISALRRGESVILDEFVRNKEWSTIYSLLTAKPGERWYFADNNEWIMIPKTWRMYFTANIGKKYGSYEVPEALASRAGGKVIEMSNPPAKEEIIVAQALMSDPEGNLIRSKDDLYKLYVLIYEIFPKARSLIEGKRQIIPISYRLIRDLTEKLIVMKDKNDNPVFQPTQIDFDEGLLKTLVETYGVYEDKTIPREIITKCLSAGLLFSESVADKVREIVGEDEYKKYKESADKNLADMIESAKKELNIFGFQYIKEGTPLPERRKY